MVYFCAYLLYQFKLIPILQVMWGCWVWFVYETLKTVLWQDLNWDVVWIITPKLSSYHYFSYLAWWHVLMVSSFKSWIFSNSDDYIFDNFHILEQAHIFILCMIPLIKLISQIFSDLASQDRGLSYKLILITYSNSDLLSRKCNER